jgi:hypothetical protein
MPRPRTFTDHERALLARIWPEPSVRVREMCRDLFGCSSKTLVREVRALGLPLRKPQRRWNVYGLTDGVPNGLPDGIAA